MNFKDILTFLSKLEKNNNKDWFNGHKGEYQKHYGDFCVFAEMLINQVSQFDKDVAGLEAKKAVFRIYRDVRFSKDKSPYKTNFGMYINPGGKKSQKSGYYLHIQPGGSFVAGGLYMPPTPLLNVVRNEIMNNYSEFVGILNQKDFKQYYRGIEGEKLKNPPKGFPTDFKDIEMLKFKSYTFVHKLSDADLTHPDIFNNIVNGFYILSPAIKFLNQAIV